MFTWLFDRLWNARTRAPGDTFEAAKVGVRQGHRYRATITLSAFEQMLATNDAIRDKLTGVGFKEVHVKGEGAKRMVEGLWGKPDTAAELDPHLSNVSEIEVPAGPHGSAA